MADYSPPPPPQQPYGSGPSGPVGEVPLSQPKRGIAPGEAIQRFFKKYATFQGRASRSEFWWTVLFVEVVNVLLSTLARSASFFTYIDGLWLLAVLVPTLSVGARRLHDTGRSGWWQLLYLTCVGTIALIVFWALPENENGNKYDVA